MPCKLCAEKSCGLVSAEKGDIWLSTQRAFRKLSLIAELSRVFQHARLARLSTGLLAPATTHFCQSHQFVRRILSLSFTRMQKGDFLAQKRRTACYSRASA